MALDAVGGQGATVDDITNALEPGSFANYYASTFNGVTTTYAGSLAKQLVLAQIAGSSPTNYGGHNLVTMLEGRTNGTAPIAGRIEDANNGFGDANVIGQAFAARGLSTAGSSKATNAVNFLLAQQCPNGGFRLNFNASKTSTSQSCTNNADAQLDVTSIAIIQLKAIGGHATAVNNAVAWLGPKQAGIPGSVAFRKEDDGRPLLEEAECPPKRGPVGRVAYHRKGMVTAHQPGPAAFEQLCLGHEPDWPGCPGANDGRVDRPHVVRHHEERARAWHVRRAAKLKL